MIEDQFGFDPFLLEIEDEEDFINFMPSISGEDVICCCRKDKPHDESMKFILIAKDPHALDTVLFAARP